ncbi:MAG TPA: NAD-dependent epimerase/dehydratase family protein [Bdellovibrionota bacterium]|jgi:uncharacterized protein YbjT (DUF2867 family)|nr:NAD-dependent epimerase/dehydratase family protein [Bdellovibrionota bacterium]
MTCALFGISGLVGSATAPLLAAHFERVLAPVRRPYANHIAKIETPVVDIEHLSTHHPDLLRGVDVLVYTLGTTLKRAGSASEFRRIEWSLATEVLTLARSSGVRRVVLLSSSGTSPDSLIPYSRVKGQIERLARDQGFSELVIAKPSLLVGDRAETRLIEGLSVKLSSPLLKPLQRWLPKVAPIQDIQVARALAAAATMSLGRSVTTLTNPELIELGGPPIRNVITV